MRWRWRAGAFGALLSLPFASCVPQADGNEWYGYYYENVTLNAQAAMSRPFASLPECHAAMRAVLAHAPRLAGYACARGCPASDRGVIADCAQVAR